MCAQGEEVEVKGECRSHGCWEGGVYRHLLNPPGDRAKMGAGLQVKEHPVLGIYVKERRSVVATT